MAQIVKLGSGNEPPRGPSAKKPHASPAAEAGSSLNRPLVGILAGVVILCVVVGGLWAMLGRGTAAPSGVKADPQGVYAPPELTGKPAPGGGPGAPAGVGAQGVYAPPELTGGR